MDMGPSACLRIGDVRVVVSSHKAQLADQSMYRYVGIEPTEQAILVNKSSVHFRADFEPIAEKLLICAAPGAMPADTAALPWTRLRPGIRIKPNGPAFAPATKSAQHLQQPDNRPCPPSTASTAIADELTAIRRDLHAHPEIGFEEVRTSGIVAEKLTQWGIEVHRGLGGTGVVGVLKGKGNGGKRIGLRADMDALPMEENTNLRWRSTIPGRFHGCGHDGHTTMLLGTARYLAETREFRRHRAFHLPAGRGRPRRRARHDQGRAVREISLRRDLRPAQRARPEPRRDRDPAGTGDGRRRLLRHHHHTATARMARCRSARRIRS